MTPKLKKLSTSVIPYFAAAMKIALFIAVPLLLMNCSTAPANESELPVAVPDNLKITVDLGDDSPEKYRSVEITANHMLVRYKKDNTFPIEVKSDLKPDEATAIYETLRKTEFDKFDDLALPNRIRSLTIAAGPVSKAFGPTGGTSGSPAGNEAVADLMSEISSLRRQYEQQRYFSVISFPEFDPSEHKFLNGTALPNGEPVNIDSVLAVEKVIQEAVEKYSAQSSAPIPEADRSNTKRQYVRFADASGNEKVWVNHICSAPDNWRETVVIEDSGSGCNFSLEVDPAKGTFGQISFKY